MSVELEQLEPLVVACIRHRGAHDPAHTGSTWEDLILWASPRRLLGRRSDIRGVGMLWDDPRQWMPEDRRYDVGIPIDPEDSADVDMPAFVSVTMPGSYLKVSHQGAYDLIPSAITKTLEVTMSIEEYELVAAPILELYRNSPAEVSESDLLTDIYVPVAQLPSRSYF